jgi:Rieske Fe-S protein
MTSHTPTPRSQDPQDVEKRNFIKGLTAAVLGFLSLALTWPLVSFLIPTETSGGGGNLPIGKPTKMTTVEDKDVQAFITTSVVYEIWVIKHAADKATVYSPLCPHLNCRYNFDSTKDEFACPCHGSIFNEAGKCIGGPAPRGLDTLPYKIENGELYVQWELFKAGIPEKIEA